MNRMLQLEKERLNHFKINVKYDHIMLHKNTEKYLKLAKLRHLASILISKNVKLIKKNV